MELVTLQSQHVDMKDTALGAATTRMARAVTKHLGVLDPETREMLKRALQEDEGTHVTGTL
jgi:hypothetical protein